MEKLIQKVDSYTTGDVEQFYRTRCRPDRQAIVIVGDIDPLAVESKIRSLFQVVPKADGPAPVFPDSVADAVGGQFFYFQDREADCARVTVDYVMDPVDMALRSTAVPFIYEYISTIGVDIMRSRMLAALEQAPFYARSADVEMIRSMDRRCWRLSVECAPDDYTEAYQFLLRTVNSMLDSDISAQEYEKGRSDFSLIWRTPMPEGLHWTINIIRICA